jgi:CRP/FNR family transcriptional regulator, dissimilatory nitrate respiration regulator
MISIMSNWIEIFDNAPVREISKGAVLFRREDPVKSMYLVQSGAIALERPLADGAPLTLHVATACASVAEASLFAKTYHCDAVALSVTMVAVLPRLKFLFALESWPNAALSLIETYAKEVQAQRTRIEILRLRRVADRLDAWIDLYGEPPKGKWMTVADQIGVSPPALYRELARRRA